MELTIKVLHYRRCTFNYQTSQADRKERVSAVVRDLEHEAFIIHVAALSVDPGNKIHPSKRAQIAYLKADEAPTKVPSKYADFANVFSSKLAVEFLEHTRINNYAIELMDDQQPPYSLIYSLGPVKLEILKAYIDNNLANGFIKPFKSLAGVFILFDKKLDDSLRLYMDYQGFNNLTIKNWYILPLVGESLDWLGRAQQFTQLDLTNAYHQMRIREEDK